MARLVVDKERITRNYELISGRCNGAGVSLLTVLKEGVARKELLDHFFEIGLTRLGLAHYPVFQRSLPGGVEKVLLYLTPWSDLKAVAETYDASFQSDPETLKRLAGAAGGNRRKHRVLLVAEVGDRREGLPIEEVHDIGALIKDKYSDRLHLAGIAANFACLSSCLPTGQILSELARCVDSMSGCFIGERPVLSIGGSDVLQWLDEGNSLPGEVTEIRCGTAVLLGTYPLSDNPVAGAFTDAIILEAEVLECREKQGRLRAVVDFGTLDTSPGDVKPPFENMVFKGASSGYTVFDVTDCPEHLSTGRHLSFRLNYRSLSRAFLSPRLSLELSG